MFATITRIISILLVIDVFVYSYNSTKEISKCNQLEVNFEECNRTVDNGEEVGENEQILSAEDPGLDWRELIDFVTDRLTRGTHSKPFDIKSSVKELSQNVYQIRDLFAKMKANLKPIDSRLRQSGFEFLQSLNVSNQCFQSIVQMSKALKTNQLWPYKCNV